MFFDIKNGVLTIFPVGQLDSSNSEESEHEIRQIFLNNPADSHVMDANELQYISSAGLRSVLRLRKDFPSLKIINTSPEVYSIFEMTGFTEMMSVEKAYRVISVDGCQIIGQGANGIVYRLDPDTIIKVYRRADSLPDIQRERELARKAFIKGIPTAIPYDVVKVGDGYGSVFELLNAKSFGDLLIEDPENLDNLAEQASGLLKQIHKTELNRGEMPDMKATVLKWAESLSEFLSDDNYEKLYGLISEIPDDNHLLHGDFQVKNVMLQNGEVLLIDMDTLCLGHPIFEFANTYLSHVGFGDLDHDNMDRFFGISYELSVSFWRKLVHYYFENESESSCDVIEQKAQIIAYTRMMARIIRHKEQNTPEGRAVIDHCKAKLSGLLSKIDSLTF